MLPAAQHVRPLGRLQPHFDQEGDDPRPEEFIQRRKAHLRHHVEMPTLHETTTSQSIA
ncbi:MAG: hypothetical protein HN758_15530 [Verrucomicrobia bacterium]|nr:hypothetical protein [Verrucomicrobiota bacterium]